MARLGIADRAAAEELFNSCYPRLAGWVRRLVEPGAVAREMGQFLTSTRVRD